MNVSVVAPLLVAATLLVSGVAKVRDPKGVGAAFTSMQVPSALSGVAIQRAFPLAEIVLGVALLGLPTPANVVASAAAVVLMAAYTVLVGRALRRPAASCHCFGKLTSGRVTSLTLARNITLLLLACLAVVDAVGRGPALVRLLHPDAAPWLAGVAVTAWLVFAVLRDGAPAREDAAPQQAAAAASDELLDYARLPTPPAVLEDPEGNQLPLAALTASRAVLLIWVSFGCGSCRPVIDNLASYRERLPAIDVRGVVQQRAWLDSVPEGVPADQFLVDPFGTLAQGVKAYGTPVAVLFGADGMLAGGPVAGPDAIEELVDDIDDQLREAAKTQPDQDAVASSAV